MDARFKDHKGRAARVALLLVLLFAFVGCLGEPGIDERWTLVEFLNVEPSPGASFDSGATVPVSVKGRITYRDIVTGFLVAELRYSPLLTPGDVVLDPEDHGLEVAHDVDLILVNSVTAGRATRAVTGFDHLMQDIDLSFDGWIPPEMSATYADSGMVGGMFLLLYLGEGDEIDLPGGEDSLLVTPFLSSEYDILSTGLELNILPPASVPAP